MTGKSVRPEVTLCGWQDAKIRVPSHSEILATARWRFSTTATENKPLHCLRHSSTSVTFKALQKSRHFKQKQLSSAILCKPKTYCRARGVCGWCGWCGWVVCVVVCACVRDEDGGERGDKSTALCFHSLQYIPASMPCAQLGLSLIHI